MFGFELVGRVQGRSASAISGSDERGRVDGGAGGEIDTGEEQWRTGVKTERILNEFIIGRVSTGLFLF